MGEWDFRGEEMIIAILETEDGFKKSIDLVRVIPFVRIPKRRMISVALPKEATEMPPLTIDEYRFRFYKWLEKDSVALYREG